MVKFGQGIAMDVAQMIERKSLPPEQTINTDFCEIRFDALAESAASSDVFIGCNCPTYANPDVNRCHTVLALSLMQRRYPQLAVEFP